MFRSAINTAVGEQMSIESFLHYPNRVELGSNGSHLSNQGPL